MLKATLRPSQLFNVKLAHISLGLVGLMWVMPFLHYRHALPLTTFDQEWWSMLLGNFALLLLVSRDYWRQPEIPRIVLLPVALIALVWLQWSLGKIVYFDHAMLYALYMLFAALLMVLGSRLRDCMGMLKLAQVLAIFLLVGSEVNALIGILQRFNLHTIFGAVMANKLTLGVYGNIAQPNHYANYIMMGLVSLGLLYQQYRFKPIYVVVMALPLLCAMAMSGSRSSWLYLLMISGLAWWLSRRNPAQKVLLRYSLMLVAAFAALHLMMYATIDSGANSGSVNTVQRVLDGSATGSIRLNLWREAAMIFAQSPFFGAGFGQYAWLHFQLSPVLQHNNTAGLYNNAHNLIFQLAAEAGVAGLLAFIVPMGYWIYGLNQRKNRLAGSGSPGGGPESETMGGARWWGYALLGILAIHSMLEYPLWYAYFLGIAAILLGALDETRYSLKLRFVGRLLYVSILLLCLVTLVQFNNSYRVLTQALSIIPQSKNDRVAMGKIREGLIAAQSGSLLTPYAELPLSGQIAINRDYINEKLALNTRVMRFMPVPVVVYRQAILLALANRQEQAKSMLEKAIWSYPHGLAEARIQLSDLAEKDSEHVSALLEFALQKEQESRRAVHHQ